MAVAVGAVGTQSFLLGSLGKSRLLRGAGSSARHDITSGTDTQGEESLPSKARGEAVELFR